MWDERNRPKFYKPQISGVVEVPVEQGLPFVTSPDDLPPLLGGSGADGVEVIDAVDLPFVYTDTEM